MSGSTDATNDALLGGFATAAADLVHTTGTTAYSYALQGSGTTATPLIDLTSATPSVFTDCSGWVNYALNSVAPLHQAALSAARDASAYNGVSNTVIDPATGADVPFSLNEATNYPWSRAFVLANAFATADGSDGFANVANFSTLQSGDLIAYSLGIYTDPSNPDASSNPALGFTADTGHTMVVTGAATEVWQQNGGASAALLADVQSARTASGGHGPDTLDPNAVSVWAVPVVDSSILAHMAGADGFTEPARDNRPETDGSYILPSDTSSLPAGAKAGGLGTGTMWYSLDANGHPLQFRFGPYDAWHPNTSDATASVISAARMTSTIDLSGGVLGTDGLLHVTLMANRTATLANADGTTSGYAMTEHLQGAGGLDVAGTGTLTLSGTNDFTGGIVLQGVSLVLADAGSAGMGAITTAAGTSNAVTVSHGGVRVVGGGTDTVSAAEAGSTVTGGQSLLFLGGGGGSTVGGGAGSATVLGGASGLYQGGAAGHNQLFSTGDGATLAGGGAGDLLVGGTGDVLLAAVGNATLFAGAGSTVADADGSTAVLGGAAAGTGNQNTDGQSTVFGSAGQDTMYGGAGGALVLGGSGATTVVGGAGTLTVMVGAGSLTEFGGSGGGTLVAGSGSGTLVVGAGAQTVEVLAGHAGGALDISGFRTGTDHLVLAGYDPASVTTATAGGALTLTLPDATTITLAGMAGVSAASWIVSN